MEDEAIIIKTTDVHLPRLIGAAVRRAFHGRLEEDFDASGFWCASLRPQTANANVSRKRSTHLARTANQQADQMDLFQIMMHDHRLTDQIFYRARCRPPGPGGGEERERYSVGRCHDARSECDAAGQDGNRGIAAHGGRRYRHVPIVEGDKVVGIVSRYDFSGLELDRLDEETGLWERM